MAGHDFTDPVLLAVLNTSWNPDAETPEERALIDAIEAEEGRNYSAEFEELQAEYRAWLATHASAA